MDRIEKSAVQIAFEYWVVRGIVATLQYPPLPVANQLGYFYARVLDQALPRWRKIAMRNLSLAYPHWSREQQKEVADGVFRSIGRVLVAFARFPSIQADSVGQWIHYQGYEHFEAAMARGKGVLFATAHLGNWELSAFSHALLSAPMHVVVRPLDNPRLDAFVERRAFPFREFSDYQARLSSPDSESLAEQRSRRHSGGSELLPGGRHLSWICSVFPLASIPVSPSWPPTAAQR